MKECTAQDFEAFAQAIIERLGEQENLHASNSIRIILERFGIEKTSHYVEEALRLFASEIKIRDDSRKRTLGGCFFLTVRKESDFGGYLLYALALNEERFLQRKAEKKNKPVALTIEKKEKIVSPKVKKSKAV